MSGCDHEFVDSNRCAKCGWAPHLLVQRQPAPSYPDDVVAVMRDTITAQREALAAKDQVIAGLRAQLEMTGQTLEEGAQAMTLARAIIDADRAMRAEKKEAAT